MNRRRFLSRFTFAAASGLFLTGARAINPILLRRIMPPKAPVLTGGGGVVPFDPASIGDLVYDWDSRYDLYSDAGTTPCVNNDPVYDWKEQVADGTLEQNTLANRPIYKATGGPNNLPYVDVADATQYMIRGSLSIVQPNSWVIVAKQASKTYVGRFLDSNGRQMCGLDTNGYMQCYANLAVPADSTDHSGAFHVFTWVFDGASSYMYIGSGSVAGPVNPGTGGVTDLFFPGYVGTQSCESVCRLLLYSKAITSGNVATIAAGFNTLYGV